MYFGYALDELSEGIPYENFVRHFAGRSFSNSDPIIAPSVRVIPQWSIRSTAHGQNRRVAIAAIEFFMMRYDTEHDKTISFKRKKHNRYTYCINFREWDLQKEPPRLIRTGYAGKLTRENVLKAVPDNMRTERYFYGMKRNKKSQSNSHILKGMLSSFGSTRKFCNDLLRSKQGNENEFYLHPKNALRATKHSTQAPFTTRRRSRSHFNKP